jgi:adenylate kinase family enzyme
MKRVAVIGNAGAGKSTLAKKLGRVLGIEVTHLDLLLWRPGWHTAPPAEFRAAYQAVLDREEWIIDGFVSLPSIEERLEQADTIVFPDYPLWRLFIWAGKRQVASLFRPRADFPPDCPQWPMTVRLFKLIRDLDRDATPKLRLLVAQHASTKLVYHLTRPSDAARLLREANAPE